MAGEEELPYNVNIGVLGHVDSGKTSLSKALSTQTSTACFDKSPQSKERGITLDLGFSAFHLNAPEEWKGKYPMKQVQYTLVDCPGHASLIKCIIGGAQIIDMMMLVIDINKGIQTQTAECIVIGEMLARNLTVVLNKCDLIPGDAAQKQKVIDKTKKKLQAVFAQTKFQAPQFVAVTAAPGASEDNKAEGLDELRRVILSTTPPPRTAAEEEKQFLMYVDHCFGIEGQGTILTGTVLQGRVSTGQTVYFPETKVDRKVRSIQVFKRPVKFARRGDRIGMSVSKVDTSMERGIVCAMGGNVRTYTCGIARIEKVRHYKAAIPSNSKLHVTVGHATVMGVVRFFCKPLVEGEDPAFNPAHTYRWLDQLDAEKTKGDAPDEGKAAQNQSANASIPPLRMLTGPRVLYALIQFEQPLTTPIGATLIASKLDTDIHSASCRLCFHGHMETALKPEEIPALRALKEKVRPATIDRVVDDYSCIGKNLVQAKTGDLTRFIGMKILFEPPRDPETGRFPEGRIPKVGVIDSSFGKSGKFKVIFKEPVFRKDEKGQNSHPKYKLYFRFEVNHFDKSKAMIQDFTGIV
eukprot:TRINITY_DN7787_c0_g1_i1.p1 TRINITY_DN7787_c0_g1~~TRINITY_DN7787_c0_g1_i1.p1  ORF type:complete len:579 (+),score=219.12 TRINITY_DN7787_c0_g1_i1:54-1790(+)